MNICNKKMTSRILLPALLCFIALLFSSGVSETFPRQDMRLGGPWMFYRGDVTGAEQTAFNDAAWDSVCLPHTARIESAKTHTSWDYYIGYCWYRKQFVPGETYKGKKLFLEVEAG